MGDGKSALARIVRKLTPEEKEKVLEAAAAGKPIHEVRAEIEIDNITFWRARKQDVEFADEFSQARAEGLEELADELLTIPDTYADVLRARLKSENIRWLLSKRKAEVYGDKVELNVNQSIDIGGALRDAKQRVVEHVPLPPRDQEIKEITQLVEKVEVLMPSVTGQKSVVPAENEVQATDKDDIFS